MTREWWECVCYTTTTCDNLLSTFSFLFLFVCSCACSSVCLCLCVHFLSICMCVCMSLCLYLSICLSVPTDVFLIRRMIAGLDQWTWRLIFAMTGLACRSAAESAWCRRYEDDNNQTVLRSSAIDLHPVSSRALSLLSLTTKLVVFRNKLPIGFLQQTFDQFSVTNLQSVSATTPIFCCYSVISSHNNALIGFCNKPIIFWNKRSIGFCK